VKTTRSRKTKTKKSRRRKADRWAALRRKLLRRRQELLRQMQGGLAAEVSEATGATFNDLADQASRALSSELAHGVAEIAHNELRMIDRALERIEKKTYGRCEVCGKRIAAGRLRALPFAELCVDCKREEEASQLKASPVVPPSRY